MSLPPLLKISPIVKPVAARCNIACDYCYYKNSHDSSAHGTLMSRAVLTRVVQDVVGLARQHGRAAEFTWHGGEPTLAGLDFYREVVSLQQACAEGVKCENNIQTNGTLLSERWVSFFKQADFSLGISLDGPQWLHDTHRFFANGQGSFNPIMASIQRLQEQGVRFGVLAVITQASLGHAREIVRYFVQQGIYRFDLAPCAELPGTAGVKWNVTADQYAAFMIDAFEAWLELDDPAVQIRFLQQTLYGLFGAEPGLCSMGHLFCGVFPTITPNGDVFFCDNYEGSEDMYLGNVLEQSLADLLFGVGARHTDIRSQIMAAKAQCRDCTWYNVCGGGCPRYNREGSGQAFTSSNFFCRAYMQIISHVQSRATQLAEPGGQALQLLQQPRMPASS